MIRSAKYNVIAQELKMICAKWMETASSREDFRIKIVSKKSRNVLYRPIHWGPRTVIQTSSRPSLSRNCLISFRHFTREYLSIVLLKFIRRNKVTK